VIEEAAQLPAVPAGVGLATSAASCTFTSRWHARRRTQQLVEELAVPPPGSQQLSFPSEFSRSRIAQYWVILLKNRKVYWRSPGARLLRTEPLLRD